MPYVHGELFLVSGNTIVQPNPLRPDPLRPASPARAMWDEYRLDLE